MEATATEIALIAKGRLVAHAAPEKLLRDVSGRVWEWALPSAELPAAKQRFLISAQIRRGDGVHVRVVGDAAPSAQATAAEPSLEDAYLYHISASRAG